MLQFERGNSVNLYSNYLTIENKEGIVIVDPKITITHIDSNNLTVIDVNEANMTLAIETLYYFKWNIPSDQDEAVYTVEYSATVDSTYAEANESIQVVANTTADTCIHSYTTVDKVAEYLGVASTAIKQDWIDWTSRYIDTYTCQTFCVLQITELLDIHEQNRQSIMVNYFPMVELIEVKNDGKIIDLNDLAVYLDEGQVKFKSYFPSSILQSGEFLQGNQTVSVTYKYGHTLVPAEIEWVATVMAAQIASISLMQSGAISSGILTEEEIGDYRKKYAIDDSGFSGIGSLEKSKLVNSNLEEDVFSAKTVLRMYRQRRVMGV